MLVIGWDGADWKVASPLIDAGKMPNLQRLVDTGVMGNISTLYPVLSPMLWTSISTGKRAHKHGIHGFAEPDPSTNTVRPITNLGRKCKTIWNILNQNGKKCNVVGWWPSNPAEPINGVMVSNHFQTAPGKLEKNQWPMRLGTVHPPELSQQLAKFRVHPYELEPQQLLPFIPDAAKIDQEKDKRISMVAKTLAECSGVHAVATAIMQHEPWDFMAVYYDAIDHFSHGFMKYHPPREKWVSEEDFELYKNVIETAYRFHDIMLGTLLQLAGPDTTVILLSDHGFHPDHLRPQMISNEPAGPADEHRQFGMLVLNGPGIKQDELVFGASLLDITPTILALYDLPVGEDMDGKPLMSVFEHPFDPHMISSWDLVEGEDGRHPQDFRIDPVDTRESLKQLAELGYIDQPDEDQNKAVQETLRELRYNLARDYLDSQHLPEAIQIFSELWDEFPDEGRFGVKLFSCYLSLKDVTNAETTLNRLIEQKQRYAKVAADELNELREELSDVKPEELNQRDTRKMMRLRRRAITNPNAFAYMRGSLLHAKGEFEEALVALKNAEGVQTYNLPSLRQKMGQCYLGLRQWSAAKQQFQEVLKINPANSEAYVGLAQCELGSKRPQKAVAAAQSAIGLIYQNPKAHFLLGNALLGLGRKTEAIETLTIATQQNKVFPECHRLLSQLYRENGEPALAEKHAAFAEKSAERIKSFHQGNELPEDADLNLDVAMDQAIGIGEIGGVNHSGDLSDSVVVVSGLPRSGTSMMMQMLQAGGVEVLSDDVRSADESNPRGYLEYEPVKQLAKNNSWIEDAKGKGVKIVSQLLPLLPTGINYRVIYMARALGEVVASQEAMLSRLEREGAAISSRKLAATYKRQVELVAEVLAKNHQVAAITVDFSEALVDPVRTAARVNQLLGGDLDEAAMSAAIDPALRNQK